MSTDYTTVPTDATGSGKPIPFRCSAHIEGDFVVFLIGMRINKWWKVHQWLPALTAMRPMLNELSADPESGLLGFHYSGRLTFVQYWRSFEHLEAYARDPDMKHWPAWLNFNRRNKHTRGDVGIWHETYLVHAGHYEAIYSGMPPTGLGKIGRLMDAKRRGETARLRLQGTAHRVSEVGEP
jgi:hypothetical protein